MAPRALSGAAIALLACLVLASPTLAATITRAEAFANAGLSSPADDGVTQHTSVVNGHTVTFDYYTASAGSFADPTTYSLTANGLSSQFGGAVVFGNYWQGNQGNGHYWSDETGGGFARIIGHTLSPVAGNSSVTIGGSFTDGLFSSRDANEIQTIDWILFRSSDGTLSGGSVSVLDSGTFTTENNTSVTEITGGDVTIDPVAVTGFNSGYIALFTQVTYTNHVATNGHVNVGDSLNYAFVPEPSTALLLGGGLLCLAARGRRSKA